MKARVILIIFSVNLVNSQIPFISQFTKWRQDNKRFYKDKFEIGDAQLKFDMNTAFITLRNSRPGKRFKLGLNEYADMSFDDFSEAFLGILIPSNPRERGNMVTYQNPSSNPTVKAGNSEESYTSVTAPASVDYRNLSLAIKNQHRCGSCWAFAAIGTLESRMKMLNSSYNTTLSEQYLVDCDTRNFGCNGGWPITALNWILNIGENLVPATSAYQYYGFKQKCKVPPKISMNINATVQNYTAGNEDMMKEIVANVGPVSAVISVTNSYQFYKSGIFFDSTCNNNCSSVNHAIIIVGYGTDPETNTDYWIIKNSWGTSWGQGGYALMSRNKGNNCNIACYAMYAI